MFSMDIIPIDMDLQKHWQNRSVVTIDMLEAFKTSLGFQPYHKLRDLTKQKYKKVYGKELPSGRVAWLRIGYRTNVIVTDLNGRNPTMIE